MLGKLGRGGKERVVVVAGTWVEDRADLVALKLEDELA